MICPEKFQRVFVGNYFDDVGIKNTGGGCSIAAEKRQTKSSDCKKTFSILDGIVESKKGLNLVEEFKFLKLCLSLLLYSLC